MKKFFLYSIFIALLFSTPPINGQEKPGEDQSTATSKAVTLLGEIDLLIKQGECGGERCETIKKAVEDSINHTERATEIRGDASQFFDQLIQNQAYHSDSASNPEMKSRADKIIDLLWDMGTQALPHTPENSDKIALEDYLVSNLAKKTATYGPGPASAFTTWYAYRKSCNKGECDPTLALRAGMVTGATSLAIAKEEELLSNIPSDSKTIRKIIVGGALSGLIIGVRGDEDHAIRRGLYHDADTVLFRDRHKKIEYKKSVAQPDKTTIFCYNTVNPDQDCPAVEGAPSETEKENIASQEVVYPIDNSSDTSLDKGKEKPQMQSMSLFDGQCIFDVNIKKVSDITSTTSTPSALLTYIGKDTHLDSQSSTMDTASGSMDMPHPPREAIEALQSKDQGGLEIDGTVAASWLCMNNGQRRRILVESPSKKPGKACRVLYQQTKSTKVPWSATYNEVYCLEKAIALTVKKIGQGWSCYAQ